MFRNVIKFEITFILFYVNITITKYLVEHMIGYKFLYVDFIYVKTQISRISSLMFYRYVIKDKILNIVEYIFLIASRTYRYN